MPTIRSPRRAIRGPQASGARQRISAPAEAFGGGQDLQITAEAFQQVGQVAGQFAEQQQRVEEAEFQAELKKENMLINRHAETIRQGMITAADDNKSIAAYDPEGYKQTQHNIFIEIECQLYILLVWSKLTYKFWTVIFYLY